MAYLDVAFACSSTISFIWVTTRAWPGPAGKVSSPTNGMQPGFRSLDDPGTVDVRSTYPAVWYVAEIGQAWHPDVLVSLCFALTH